MQTWPEALLLTLTMAVMLVGLFGSLIPIFPGPLILWLAALGYGVLAGFDAAGLLIFLVITLLVIAGMLADNVLMGAGARQGGASWRTILIALAAGVVGTLIFPPFGGLIAAPLAILVLEYNRLRDWEKARKSLFGMATGWGVAFLVRFAFSAVAFVLWLLWVWLNRGA